MRSLGWLVLALLVGAITGAGIGLLRRRPPAAYSDAYTRLERDAATPTTAAYPFDNEQEEIYRVSSTPSSS